MSQAGKTDGHEQDSRSFLANRLSGGFINKETRLTAASEGAANTPVQVRIHLSTHMSTSLGTIGSYTQTCATTVHNQCLPHTGGVQTTHVQLVASYYRKPAGYSGSFWFFSCFVHSFTSKGYSRE